LEAPFRQARKRLENTTKPRREEKNAPGEAGNKEGKNARKSGRDGGGCLRKIRKQSKNPQHDTTPMTITIEVQMEEKRRKPPQ